ncbi:MAG: hypothetical protein ACD_46C00219G0005 [uncultured bacterium]|nr:MAG: hypothetical protein ACD_46C00219G0005 [uncultured bacterium]
MILILNSNSNTCRIYQYHKNPAKLELIKEIVHPENRLKKSDYLTSDKPGRYRTSNAAHGAYSDGDPKETEFDNFSREIAKELDTRRKNNSIEKLIIITAPHMNGLLHQHLNPHVQSLITHNIQKDLLHLTDHELLKYLQENTQFIG